MAENKVVFGLKNVHYAIMSVSGGTISWGTPKSIAGAVSLSLSAQGGEQKFYADNILYYTTIANQGYEGDIEFAKLPDSVLQDLFGYELDATDKVLTEMSDVEPIYFALGFQIDGDQEGELHWLYNCVANRPEIDGSTITDTKEPNTQTCSITIAPLPDGRIRVKTTADTPTATRTSWFSSVYQ